MPAHIPPFPYRVWGGQCGTHHELWLNQGVLDSRQHFQFFVWSGTVHTIWGGVWLVLWHGGYILLTRPFALWSAKVAFCYLWPFGVGLVMPVGQHMFDGGSGFFLVWLGCCLGWGQCWQKASFPWSAHEGLSWGCHVSKSCVHTLLLGVVAPSFLVLSHTMVEDIVQARRSFILSVHWF